MIILPKSQKVKILKLLVDVAASVDVAFAFVIVQNVSD